MQTYSRRLNRSEDVEQLEETHIVDFDTLYFQSITKSKQNIKKATTRHSDGSSSTVKLLTISLPQFRGDFEEWIELYNTFNSLIHNNASLNEIQKFNYFRSSLKNKAAQFIVSLNLTVMI